MPDAYIERAVKYAQINAAADGSQSIALDNVTTRQQILVLNYNLTATGTGNSRLRSFPSDTTLLTVVGGAGPAQFSGNDGNVGAFKLQPGEVLNIFNDAGVDITGHIAYRVVMASTLP